MARGVLESTVAEGFVETELQRRQSADVGSEGSGEVALACNVLVAVKKHIGSTPATRRVLRAWGESGTCRDLSGQFSCQSDAACAHAVCVGGAYQAWETPGRRGSAK